MHNFASHLRHRYIEILNCFFGTLQEKLAVVQNLLRAMREHMADDRGQRQVIQFLAAGAVAFRNKHGEYMRQQQRGNLDKTQLATTSDILILHIDGESSRQFPKLRLSRTSDQVGGFRASTLGCSNIATGSQPKSYCDKIRDGPATMR
jgi:hypothetical protein